MNHDQRASLARPTLTVHLPPFTASAFLRRIHFASATPGPNRVSAAHRQVTWQNGKTLFAWTHYSVHWSIHSTHRSVGCVRRVAPCVSTMRTASTASFASVYLPLPTSSSAIVRTSLARPATSLRWLRNGTGSSALTLYSAVKLMQATLLWEALARIPVNRASMMWTVAFLSSANKPLPLVACASVSTASPMA